MNSTRNRCQFCTSGWRARGCAREWGDSDAENIVKHNTMLSYREELKVLLDKQPLWKLTQNNKQLLWQTVTLNTSEGFLTLSGKGDKWKLEFKFVRHEELHQIGKWWEGSINFRHREHKIKVQRHDKYSLMENHWTLGKKHGGFWFWRRFSLLPDNIFPLAFSWRYIISSSFKMNCLNEQIS